MDENTASVMNACQAWFVSLLDPLISTKRRIELDQGIARAFNDDYRFVSLWFAGQISSLLRSLPDSDEWRKAVSKFALTWEDGIDLAEPFEPPEFEPWIAGLYDGLSCESTELLREGFKGWREAWSASHEFEPDPHQRNLDALRWAVWRHRAWAEVADVDPSWFEELSLNWSERALWIIRGKADEAAVDAEIDAEVKAHKIIDYRWDTPPFLHFDDESQVLFGMTSQADSASTSLSDHQGDS